MNEQANKLAHYLKEAKGMKEGDLVGMLTERSEKMIFSLWGILKAGGAYVPIDPDYPTERKKYILENAGIKLLLTDSQDSIEELGQESWISLVFSNIWGEVSQMPTHNPLQGPAQSNRAYVIYTSGSTGKPKGVVLGHRAVVNRIHWMWNEYDFTSEDIILQKTPYVFDVSVWELFMSLCFGAKLVLVEKKAVYDPLDAVNKDNKDRLSKLKRIITSGEALLVESVKKHHEKLDADLHNLYGPTEAAVDVSAYTTSGNDAIIPIGKPIDNVQLHILDENLDRVPLGVSGEICIAGVCLANEYLNRPALTEKAFVPHPFEQGERLYRTGDIGRWLPNGDIEFLGRRDHQVKIRGFRIVLEEIE